MDRFPTNIQQKVFKGTASRILAKFMHGKCPSNSVKYNTANTKEGTAG